MAPEAANQKRKRGRPSNASRDDGSASQTQSTLTIDGAISRPVDSAHEGDLEEESRPRKRGRKAKQTKPDQPGPGSPVSGHTEQLQKKTKNKKRGNPAFSQKPKRTDEPEVEEPPIEVQKPAKRGQSKAATVPEVTEKAAESNAVAKNKLPKKRGRPSLNVSHKNAPNPRPSDIPQKKKPGRPPRQPEPADDEQADDENEGNSSLLRRSGRERQKGSRIKAKKQSQPRVEPPEEDADEREHSSLLRRSPRDRSSKSALYKANQQPGDKSGEGDAEGVAYSKKAKQGGRSSQNSEVTEANQTQGGKKTKSAKRGLQAGADQAGKENTENTEKPRRKNHGRISLNEETAPTEIQKPRRRKKDKQLAVAVIEEAEPESGVEQESRPRTKQKRAARASNQARQRRTSDEQAGSRSSSPEPAPYRHLVNHTRHITRHTIQETWSPLDSACVDSVANILHVASRPVLLRLNNLTKHAQATSALNAISNRLRSKLTRGLPFPPATTSNRREDELDFEYTVDGTEILEAQLDPLLHSVALLQREKERAEQELGRDYKILNSLSINAKSEMRGRKEQLRKVHLLVPDTRSDGNSPDSRRLGNLEVSETVTSKTFSMLEGDDLQGLAGQLGNHMESMRGNLQQIEGVIPAITDSRAALRHALLSHLSQDAFDQVILG